MNFSEVRFANTVFLGNAIFNGEVDFSNATMPDTLILTNITTNKRLNLTNVKQGARRCRLYLNLRDLERVAFNYEHFKLSFEDYFTKKTFSVEYTHRLFKALEANQKKYGSWDGRIKVMYEYKLFKDELKFQKRQRIAKGVLLMLVIAVVIYTFITFAKNNQDFLRFVWQSIQNKWSRLTSSRWVSQPAMGRLPKVTTQIITKTSKNEFQEPLANIKIHQLEIEGARLWADYQPPGDILQEPEKFWKEYEQLLEKVKTKSD